MDIAFLAIRMPHRRLEPMARVAASILHRTRSACRFHVIADQPARALLHGLQSMSSLSFHWHVYYTGAAPRWVARLHKRLIARGCVGPACDAYMHKPLLHGYLPRKISKVIFLDSDVFLFSDIALLWRQFGSFTNGQMIALAAEENPFASQEPVIALGGISANGGVELLDLNKMRRGGYNGGYTALLWRYASRDPALPLNGQEGLGLMGEQTLYSWMSINASDGHSMFGRLDCSWNVQIASWPSHVSSVDADRAARRCDRCELLHGAGGEAKGLMAELARDATGRACSSAFDHARQRSRHYPPGSPSERLFLAVRSRCCGRVNAIQKQR